MTSPLLNFSNCLFTIALILLSVKSNAQGSCQSAYDNNFNNNTTANQYWPGPAPIPLNTNINGIISSGSDVDYYKFYITTGGTISVSLTNLPANYNLRLCNSNGSSIAQSNASGTANENINYTVTSNTWYFALVLPKSSNGFNANACYTLRVSTGTATMPEAPDSEGLNDLVKKVDVELYPNPASDQVTIDYTAFTVSGQATLKLINSLGQELLTQPILQSRTTLNVSELPSGGLYHIIITNPEQALPIYRKLLINR
jgi:hypothetical protein